MCQWRHNGLWYYLHSQFSILITFANDLCLNDYHETTSIYLFNNFCFSFQISEHIAMIAFLLSNKCAILYLFLYKYNVLYIAIHCYDHDYSSHKFNFKNQYFKVDYQCYLSSLCSLKMFLCSLYVREKRSIVYCLHAYN